MKLTNEIVGKARCLWKRRTRSRVAVWSVTAIVDFLAPGCHPRVMARAIFGFSHPDCEVEAPVLLRIPLLEECHRGSFGEAKLCRKCRSRFWAARCPSCFYAHCKRFSTTVT